MMIPRHHESRSRALCARRGWLCAAAFSLLGCRDLKADSGFCASCPGGTDQTRDAQAVIGSDVPAADGGGIAGGPASSGTGSAGMFIAASSGSGGSFSQASDAGVSIGGGGVTGMTGGAGAAALDAQVPLAGRSGVAGHHAAGSGGSAGSTGAGCTPACTPAKPVCEPASQQCVECLVGNTDACPSDAPACDPMTHKCVPCAEGQTSACSPKTPVCEPTKNTCVACTADQPGACQGDTPACASNRCVQCNDANLQACSGATPNCEQSSSTCVGCRTDQPNDCGSADRPRCDGSTKTCENCSADSDCARFVNAPICDSDSGSCVACTRATEMTACPGTACVLANHSCGTRTLGTVADCMPCQADDECTPNSLCAVQPNSRDGASFCFPRTQGMPGYDRAMSGPSIDDVVGSYFLPAVSCQTLLAAGKPCPAMSGRCGDPNIGDGRCEMNLCTFACTSDADCPAASHCDSAVCRAP